MNIDDALAGSHCRLSRTGRWSLPAALATALWTLVAGCTGTARLAAPPKLFDSAVPAGFANPVRTTSMDWRDLPTDAAAILERARASSADGKLHILALSGGGAGGAFGAGALVGLGERKERPEFQIVTGVSTGALLAPFAFLGPAWDDRLTAAFNGTQSATALQRRSIDVLFRAGIYRGRGLFEIVDRFVTADMVAAVAREAERGRLLLVATTDLDKEEPVIWDLGAIARRGGEDARALFRDVLLASASIPGAFPPVILRVQNGHRQFDEMHVDGATTLPFFTFPDALLLNGLPRESVSGGEIYVLINGQIGTQPRTTPARTIPIVARSLSAGLRHSARTELALTASIAERYGMRLRFATLAIDHDPVRTLDLGVKNMGSLYAYGHDCAVRGLLWVSIQQAEASGDRALSRVVESSGRTAGEAASCPLDETVAGLAGDTVAVLH